MQAFAARPSLGLPAYHEMLARESGCTVLLRPYPTARLWKEYFAGDLDIAFGAIQSGDRDAVGAFVATTQDQWVLLTMRPESTVPERLEQYVDRHELLVSVLHGGIHGPGLDEVIAVLRKHGQIDEFSDIDNGLQKLRANRDAALLTNSANLDYILTPRRIQALKLRTLPQPQFPPSVSGIYLSRKSLNETDRGLLLKAIYSPASAELAAKLREAYRRELQEADGADRPVPEAGHADDSP
jgi:polar amino acid transport system substrate-binding protein